MKRLPPNIRGAPSAALGELLDSLAIEEGTYPTAVPGVRLTRRSRVERRHPAIYEPVIIFIG